MGLDVYVGALSRYYLREWQNEVEQMMANPEAMVTIDGVDYPASSVQAIESKLAGQPFAPTTFPEALEAIENWRAGLAAALGRDDFDWAEREESPYTTRKITWDCYSALLLWAAYTEHPEMPRPEVLPEDPDQDPALIESRRDANGTRYPHLLGETEIWFPVEDNRTFRGPDPTGATRSVGFVIPLFTELEDLNERTWAADTATLDAWWDGGPPPPGASSLEDNAKFGFAVLRELCFAAHRNRLVIVLDY